eukprot:c21919_g1_i1 orf=44-751(-)
MPLTMPLHRALNLSLALRILCKVQDIDRRGDNSFSTFAAAKSQFGSIIAFHGTAAENMHSIVRCGLLNLSNTNLQRNGAIFGGGIYLSTDPMVALGFSKASDGWHLSCFGQRIKYLLVCEVARGDKVLCSKEDRTSSPDSALHKSLGTYVVVENSEMVRLRYIFVYTELSNTELHSTNVVNSRTHDVPLSVLSHFKRLNWCKLIVAMYIALLLIIAYLKCNASKHGRQHLPSNWK